MDEDKKKRMDMPDPKELKEILGVVSTEIPKLLEAVSQMMYKTENAENLGKSIATFYKQLKDAGMDDAQAYQLTQKYMANFSLGGMIGQMVQGKGRDMGDQFSEDLEKRIYEKMRKKMDEDDE